MLVALGLAGVGGLVRLTWDLLTSKPKFSTPIARVARRIVSPVRSIGPLRRFFFELLHSRGRANDQRSVLYDVREIELLEQ